MEEILFSNNFNQSEYLRTLAKSGVNTFALRVLNDLEICTYILQRLGSFPSGVFISSKEQDYIFYHLGKGDYIDAKNIRRAIDSFRDSVPGDVLEKLDEYLSDDFIDKKRLIKEQYIAYTKYKKEHDLYDKHDLLNYILSQDIHIDITCSYYKEFGISKLFLELLNKVFKEVKELSLNDTFKPKHKDIHFMKAYGRPCEADYIFSEIQKYPVDECEIVLTSSADALEIYQTAKELNIPFTSHIGVPLISTKAGNLLLYLLKLEDNSFGVDAYKELFSCNSFNRDFFKSLIPEASKKPEYYYQEFIKSAGWLRLNFDSNASIIHDELYHEDVLPLLKELQSSLSLGRSTFIEKYILNPEPIDFVVIDKIRSIEEASKKYSFNLKDVLNNLLSSFVNKEISKSGHLYISDISSALSSLRKHVFVFNLNSDFPGGPKENYLIFDEEYAKTGSNQYDSKEIVKQKERVLRALVDASEDLYLTYSYFDLASLEDKNPSSIIFDLFEGDTVNITKYGYQDMKLERNKAIYLAMINNLRAKVDKDKVELSYDPTYLLNKRYSPSAFHNYFEEENRLSFLLTQVLNINIDEEDDPYQVISPSDKGTLIHKVMEKYKKSRISLKDFLFKANNEFEKFLLMKPAMIPSSKKKAKEEYLKLMADLYEADPDNECVYSEKYLQGNINGLLFGGALDRLEKDKSGKYILVDYKTGKNVLHSPDDPISCIQGLIYAYLLENYNGNYNLKVDHIEFRYPVSKVTIKIFYNEDTKKALFDLIKEYIDSVTSGTLFNGIDIKKQSFIDKYQHLYSLIKEIGNNELRED